MKVNEFKRIEEGFLDVYNQAFKGISDNPEAEKADKKKREATAAKLFKQDFIKDFKVDFGKYVKSGAIDVNTQTPAVEPTVEPEAPIPPPQPTQPAGSTAQTRQDALNRSAQRRANAAAAVTENTTYAKLNSILESIINEEAPPGAGAPPPAPAAASATPASATPASVSIYDWVIDQWFPAYMTGVAYKKYQSEIEDIAKKIQSTKGTAGIDALADIAWKATVDQEKPPRGASNVPGLTFRDNNAAMSSKDMDQLMKKIKLGGPEGAAAEKQILSLIPKGSR